MLQFYRFPWRPVEVKSERPRAKLVALTKEALEKKLFAKEILFRKKRLSFFLSTRNRDCLVLKSTAQLVLQVHLVEVKAMICPALGPKYSTAGFEQCDPKIRRQ
ncbi:hypothetical protein D3C87_1639220 [compost metagenome]